MVKKLVYAILSPELQESLQEHSLLFRQIDTFTLEFDMTIEAAHELAYCVNFELAMLK